ncbi:MAG: hypothetical protein PWQ55_1451 [Chloroflexota bacterium]|nr:hypothetical protein [Chloroflexota bacterium]
MNKQGNKKQDKKTFINDQWLTKYSQAIFDNMLEGCQVIDDSWHYLYINATAAQQGQYPLDAYVGHTVMELFPGVENTDMFPQLKRSMDEHVAQNIENEFIFQNGTKRWFELRIQPIPKGIFIFSNEISARKNLEHQIREEKRKQETLISNLPGMVYRCVNDAEWSMEYLSNGCLSLTGYSPEELIDNARLSYNDLIHPDDAQRVWQSIQKAVSNQEAFTVEYRIQTREGKEKWVWEQGRAIDVDESGRVHLEGFISDVSGQHSAQEQLGQREIQSRLFIEHAPAAIAMFDQDMRYLSASDRWKKDNGLSDTHIIGKSHYEISTDLPPEWKSIHQRGLAGETISKDEDRYLRSDGSVQWLKWEVLPWFTVNDDIGGILIMTEDITEKKNAELALSQSVARYQTLVEQLPAITYIAALDEMSTTIYISPQVEQYLGYSQDEYKTNPNIWLDHLHPLDRDRVLSEIDKKNNSNKSTVSEYRMLSKDGNVVWFRDESRIVRDESGEPAFQQGIMLDITEQKANEEELQRYILRIKSLLDVEKVISSTLNLDKVLDFIIIETTRLVSCDTISIQILNEDHLIVQAFHSQHPSQDIKGLLIQPRQDYPLIDLLETKEAVNVVDLQRDFPEYYNLAITKGQEVHSWLGVPLIYKDRLVGLITLGKNIVQEFSKSEIDLVETLANHAAMAIENARLYSESQSRMKRITSLHQIDKAISSSFDLNAVLKVLIDQVVNRLHVDAADVLLYNTETDTLEFCQGRGFRLHSIDQSNVKLGEGYSGRAARDHRSIFLRDLEHPEFPYTRANLIEGEDFVSFSVVPLIAKKKIVGVLEIYNRSHLEPEQEWIDFLETLAGQAAIAVESVQLFDNMEQNAEDLRYAYDATIEGWSMAMDLRDSETEGHTIRVAEIALDLAERFGLDENERMQIRRGALLHDMGKLGIPDAILLKPGKLTEEEWQLMRQHPKFAYEMLSKIEYLRPALDIPYAHHERWDGSGYPRGLKGEEIPLAARIFAIVDVWDALLSDRPYRKAWSIDKTRQYLLEQSNKHFDPQVVEAFMEMIDENEELEIE